MYRIPKELDLSKAIGEFTTQIRVGLYDIEFDLGCVSFAVQSPIELRRSGELVAMWEEGKWPQSGFKEIFNVSVSSIQIPSDRKIIVEFENGVKMHLVDNSDKYESMQITIEGEAEPWII